MSHAMKHMTDTMSHMMTAPVKMPLAGMKMMMNMMNRECQKHQGPAGMIQMMTAPMNMMKKVMEMGAHPKETAEQVSGLLDMMRAQLIRAGVMMTTPEDVRNLTVDVYRYSMDLYGEMETPESLALSIKELQNKFMVFTLVKQVDKALNVPKNARFELGPYVEKCYAMGDFKALWAVEGLGHNWADSFFNTGAVPSKIMHPEVTGEIPAKAQTMLHAGIGLAFAQHEMGDITFETTAYELKPKIIKVVEYCLDNSIPGYEGAALESLGLFIRAFNTTLLDKTEEVLSELEMDAPVREYFWRGVGRALYFSPESFLPLVNQRQFEWARREAPDEVSAHNTFAGLSWAYAMVQLLNPEIIEGLVVNPLAPILAANPGFSNGIQSGLIMRNDTSPGADFNRTSADYAGGENWKNLVGDPAKLALDIYYPILRDAGKLGEVFRYHDLAAYTAELKG